MGQGQSSGIEEGGGGEQIHNLYYSQVKACVASPRREGQPPPKSWRVRLPAQGQLFLFKVTSSVSGRSAALPPCLTLPEGLTDSTAVLVLREANPLGILEVCVLTSHDVRLPLSSLLPPPDLLLEIDS